MKSWQDLLAVAKEEKATNKYGPNSSLIFRTFNILNRTAWFSKVGQFSEFNGSVVTVASWNEAIMPIATRSDVTYGPNGHLTKPSELCIAIIESEIYHAIWQQAGDDAFEYYNFKQFLPRSLSDFQKDFIDEYIYEFVSFLLAEVVAPEVVGTTYFREMLAWFYAGHFPCGWVGDWPKGHLRVY